jgi:hypothetical protein
MSLRDKDVVLMITGIRGIRRISKVVLLVCAVLFAYAAAAAAQEDITPPSLLGFRFTPIKFDVGKEAGTMSVTFVAKDDLSGVKEVDAIFVSPSRKQQLQAVIGVPQGSKASGNDTYETRVTIPRYSEFGDWTVDQVILIDQVGNQIRYGTEQLKSKGFETKFSIAVSK